MNVLLVEDDAILNDTVSHYLTLKGYRVTSLHDGLDAIAIIDQSDFDIFIIDINISRLSGLEVVRYVRQKNLSSPVVVITASIELANFKAAFSLGCSDYIKKPFHLEELDIRINRLIANASRQQSTIHISESISYDFEYGELTVGESVINLRKKERRLLYILLKNINKTLPTEVIENYVWENEVGDSYPLRQLVNDLRKHLGGKKEFICSDRGIGYRFATEG
jgi:DNA-binding response OmpR family regulator